MRGEDRASLADYLRTYETPGVDAEHMDSSTRAALAELVRSELQRRARFGRLVLLVIGIALSILATLSCRSCYADTPVSKCWTSICVGPEVSVSLVAYNLTSRSITAGLLPVGSVGYGARTVGDYLAAGLYLSAQAGGKQPGYLAPAVLVRLFRAFTVGVQISFGEDAMETSILAGGGFGL